MFLRLQLKKLLNSETANEKVVYETSLEKVMLLRLQLKKLFLRLH